MKKKILKLLQKGKKSTAEISARLNRNHYDTIDSLNELKKEDKIVMIRKNTYTYWRIKE